MILDLRFSFLCYRRRSIEFRITSRLRVFCVSRLEHGRIASYHTNEIPLLAIQRQHSTVLRSYSCSIRERVMAVESLTTTSNQLTVLKP
jgi:hypothetical protein